MKTETIYIDVKTVIGKQVIADVNYSKTVRITITPFEMNSDGTTNFYWVDGPQWATIKFVTHGGELDRGEARIVGLL